jgi:3-oxoacyl-[acyl-carrier protein] reductase
MNCELDFAGQTVLVVGGSSGIGNAIARAFRARGASVQAWGTRQSAADYASDTESSLDGIAYAQVDVTNPVNVSNGPLAFDRLDVLVLAQGSVLYDSLEFSSEGFSYVVNTNLNSLMACAMRFQPLLQTSLGSITILSSVAAFRSTRGNPAYNASKAGAVALTRTLGEAWASKGIRVNSIAPGLVDTKLTQVTTRNPRRLDESLKRIPMGRLGTPEDMAGVALFLASPLAAYITGQTIVVDGGMVLAELSRQGAGTTIGLPFSTM